MSITTISSREFNQNVSGAKRAANKGPVFITDRGQTANVLLSIGDYEKIADKQVSIVELLSMKCAGNIDFNPPRLNKNMYKPADLS